MVAAVHRCWSSCAEPLSFGVTSEPQKAQCTARWSASSVVRSLCPTVPDIVGSAVGASDRGSSTSSRCRRCRSTWPFGPGYRTNAGRRRRARSLSSRGSPPSSCQQTARGLNVFQTPYRPNLEQRTQELRRDLLPNGSTVMCCWDHSGMHYPPLAYTRIRGIVMELQ